MKKVILIISILLLQVQLHAQTLTIGSVEEAFKLAIETNPDYQNYLLNQEKAALEYKQSKNYRLPTVSGVFSGQRNIDLATTPLPGEIFGQPGEVINTQFGQDYNFNAGINIGKELINREAIVKSKLSHLNSELAEVEKGMFEELLKEQVGLYYFTGLVAQRAIQIGGSDLKSATQIVELVAQKYEEGLVDLTALNNAKINRNAVKQGFNTNKQLEVQCTSELKKILGLGVQDTLLISGNFVFATDLKTIDLAPEQELTVSELQAEQANLQLKQSRSLLLPSLSVNTYLGRQQFRDDLGMDFGANSWTNYSYLSLNLSIPIFTGFSTRSKINQNKISYRIADNQWQTTKRNVLLNDERLLTDYQFCLEDVNTSTETFELYEQNKDLNQERYEEGLIGLDTYLTSFEDYIRAENAYLNALNQLYATYTQILPRI